MYSVTIIKKKIGCLYNSKYFFEILNFAQKAQFLTRIFLLNFYHFHNEEGEKIIGAINKIKIE